MTSSPIHLNPCQAGEIAAAAGAQRLLLTHLRPGADRTQALAMARKAFAGQIEAASEGAEYEVPGRCLNASNATAAAERLQ
jgi:ribonuclease BN (tRNA processing enzyme)